jgi:plasmid stabilization system protein ParE
MVYKVILSNRSIVDLRTICEYIAKDNPDAARKFGHALLDDIQELERLPRRGRIYDESNKEQTYQILLRNYHVYYQINEAQKCIEVLHILHGARREPEL